MTAIRIPRLLAAGVRDDDLPERHAWLAGLGAVVAEVAAAWGLSLGDPYEPGGYCAWVAPARTANGDEVALKVAWNHWEADHEAEGLRAWDGNGAIAACGAPVTVIPGRCCWSAARLGIPSGPRCPSPSRTS